MKKSNLQKKKKRSEMSDFERVQDFQRNLYRKAKQEKDFRFYVLYDKIRLPHFLREAYRRAKANGGAPGVDKMTFDDIERQGVKEFLQGIAEELEAETYRPQPVRRVMIPKENGKTRPLGIPTIKDRVVQTACKLVIEPIFEADFEDSSYGFRPKRSAADAIAKIKEHLKEGKTDVFDADLTSYFDTIPHSKLMQCLGQRISDKKVLHLIKMWLKTPTEEDGQMKGGKKNKQGTPQGGVISPLLANIYLHVLDKLMNKDGGPFAKYGLSIVRYADDFVLMGRGIPKPAMRSLVILLERMELRLNEEKSKMVKAKIEPFNFLGFTIRYDRSVKFATGKYWNIFPSKESSKKMRRNIKEYLDRAGHMPPEIIVKELNSRVRGWLNYFEIPGVSYTWKPKRDLSFYLSDRLRRYYKRKSQRGSKLRGRGAYNRLVSRYGLIEPTKYCRMTTVKA
jgi:RNA-directed DNA polymerase